MTILEIVTVQIGTDWDRLGINWDVPIGTMVGTDRDEVGTDWDDGKEFHSNKPKPRVFRDG